MSYLRFCAAAYNQSSKGKAIFSCHLTAKQTRVKRLRKIIFMDLRTGILPKTQLAFKINLKTICLGKKKQLKQLPVLGELSNVPRCH